MNALVLPVVRFMQPLESPTARDKRGRASGVLLGFVTFEMRRPHSIADMPHRSSTPRPGYAHLHGEEIETPDEFDIGGGYSKSPTPPEGSTYP